MLSGRASISLPIIMSSMYVENTYSSGSDYVEMPVCCVCRPTSAFKCAAILLRSFATSQCDLNLDLSKDNALQLGSCWRC